jgi:hypothetical protein
MSNFKLIPLLPALGFPPLRPSVGTRDFQLRADLVWLPAHLVWTSQSKVFVRAGLAAGVRCRHVVEDMLLRDAEVQYVCPNAARQSHGSPFAAVAAIVGFFLLPDTSPRSKRLKVSSWLAVL